MIEKNTTISINQDEISHYLKDLRKIKVMTPEREKELSKMIQSPNVTEKEKQKIEREDTTSRKRHRRNTSYHWSF